MVRRLRPTSTAASQTVQDARIALLRTAAAARGISDAGWAEIERVRSDGRLTSNVVNEIEAELTSRDPVAGEIVIDYQGNPGDIVFSGGGQAASSVTLPAPTPVASAATFTVTVNTTNGPPNAVAYPAVVGENTPVMIACPDTHNIATTSVGDIRDGVVRIGSVSANTVVTVTVAPVAAPASDEVDEWRSGELVSATTERVQNRLSDGEPRLWRSRFVRTTGAAWNELEEDQWTDLGAYTPPVDLGVEFVYANETDRAAETGRAITAADIANRKIFEDDDTGLLWRATGTPGAVVWKALSGDSASILNVTADVTYDKPDHSENKQLVYVVGDNAVNWSMVDRSQFTTFVKLGHDNKVDYTAPASAITSVALEANKRYLVWWEGGSIYISSNFTPEYENGDGHWDANTNYTGTFRKTFLFDVPATPAYVTADGFTLTPNRTYNLIYSIDRTAINSGPDFDPAECSIANYVGPLVDSGTITSGLIHAYDWAANVTGSEYRGSNGVAGVTFDSSAGVILGAPEDTTTRVTVELRRDPNKIHTYSINPRHTTDSAPSLVIHPDTGAFQVNYPAGWPNQNSTIDNVQVVTHPVYGNERIRVTFDYTLPLAPTFPLQVAFVAAYGPIADLSALAFDTEEAHVLGIEWETVELVDTPPELWLDTTDGINAGVGNRYIVGLGHTVNFPATPPHGSEIIGIPVNGDWGTLSATFEGGTATIGQGQELPLLAESDQATFVYQQGANNWLVATGGAVSPALYTKVNTFAEIPAPSTLLVGTQYLVINDVDPDRNGFWTAAGANLGATATTLVKG